MTYAELDASLQGRCRNSRKLANNTYAIRFVSLPFDGAIAIRFHHTDILTFRPDGSVMINTGGWETVTTKERLNRYLPNYGIYSHRFGHESVGWFLFRRGEGWWDSDPIAKFENGMVVIAPDGSIEGAELYIDWLHEFTQTRRNNAHATRVALMAARPRCWEPIPGPRFCNFLLSEGYRCSRHGYLTLPGHEKED